jgi:hypothetical protein
MAREWSIAIDFELEEPWAFTSDEVADQISELLARLEPYAAVASHGRQSIGVQLSVTGTSPIQVMDRAFRVVTGSMDKVGIPRRHAPVHVELEPVEELDRRLQESGIPPLVGITEAAQILGVSKQRAWELSKTPDFPRPYADLAAGPVWNRHAVARFTERWPRRPGRPKKTLEEKPSASAPRVTGRLRRRA